MIDYIFGSAEAIVIGVSSWTFYKMQRNQIRMTEMLSYFERSTVFDPELLQKVLSNQASSVYMKSIKNFENGSEFSRGIAMIQGFVDSD